MIRTGDNEASLVALLTSNKMVGTTMQMITRHDCAHGANVQGLH